MNRVLTARSASLMALGFLLSMFGCDGEKEERARDLRDLRVIGITADRPDLLIEDLIPAFIATAEPESDEVGTEVTRLSVVDYHPSDLGAEPATRSYQWVLCFSLGGITRFDCLGSQIEIETPSNELSVTDSMVASLVVDLFNGDGGGAGMGAFGSPDALKPSDECVAIPADSCESDSECADGGYCEFGTCAALPDVISVPLTARVRVETEDGQSRDAVRGIKIRLRGPPNENPRFDGLSIDGNVFNESDQPGCFTVPDQDFLAAMEFEARIASDAVESFEISEPEGCRMTTEENSMFLSWYTSAGELERGLGRLDGLENQLTLPEAPTAVRVFAVLRDGRGGISTTCVDIQPSD